jgi:hypothetical protein
METTMRISRSVLSIVFLMMSCSIILAQTITGSVTGTVVDESGAIVTAGSVTAVNGATHESFPTTTNHDGIYTIQFLPPGSYILNVKANGFRPSQIGPFVIQVDQVAHINAKLAVGSDTQTVTVTGAAPILNTENSTLGQTIDSAMSSEIPLPAQNPAALGLLMPGTLQPNPSAIDNVGRAGSEGTFMVNGNRQESNDFTLDGQDLTQAIDNTVGYTPSLHALAETKIITGNGTAEYGNANGGQVVMITKSGTNAFHGEAFWYLENKNLDANSWTNKHVTSGSPLPISPLNRDIFGGTFGGPILHDKLFFFVDYQGNRQHITSSAFRGVPTVAMRAGLDNYNGKTSTVTNPVAQFLLANPQIYPLPNQGASASVAQDYLGNQSTFVRNNQGDVKLDWRVRQSDSISTRISLGRDYEGTSQVVIPTDQALNIASPYTAFIVNWTHIFSPNLISETRAGYGRTRNIATPQDIDGDFGLTGNQKIGVPSAQTFPGFTAIILTGNVTGISNIGPVSGGLASENTTNTFTYGTDFSWQLGRHTVKFGAQALRYQENRFFAGSDGVFGHFNATGAYTGGSWGDFLTDQMASYGKGISNSRWGQRQWRPAVFVQDDYKLMSNLTLNLGVRWEYDQPLYEVQDRQANISLATGAISNAGQNGASRALYQSYFGGFMPRIGFAYSPKVLHDRLAVNGGYAMTVFMEGTGANLRLTLNPPYFIDATSAATGGASFQMTSGFPVPANPNTFSGTVRAWQPNLKPALVQQYDLMMQYQLSNTMALQVGYAGQNGDHLVDPREGDQAPCSIYPLPNQPTGCAIPLITQLPLVTQISYTESESVMNYNALQATFRKAIGNGLQLLANYTFSRSFANNKGFYGSTGADAPNNYYQNAYNPQADYGLNYFDATHLFSLSGYYQLPIGRGRLVGAHWNSVENTLLGGWKVGVVAQAHTGFPLTLTSSQYYFANQRAYRPNFYRTLKLVNQSANNWFGTDPSASPCLNKNASSVTVSGNKNKVYQSNDNGVCAYGEQLSTGFGTAGVGTVRGPGFKDVDASAAKVFAMPRESSLEFRADAFNVLNTVSLSSPTPSVSSATFGLISSTLSTERRVQLSLNLKF